MTRRYRMLKDSTSDQELKAGTIVYSCVMHDYGMAGDDTRLTGEPRISVTLKSDGGYPFFTVAERDVEQVAS